MGTAVCEGTAGYPPASAAALVSGLPPNAAAATPQPPSGDRTIGCQSRSAGSSRARLSLPAGAHGLETTDKTRLGSPAPIHTLVQHPTRLPAASLPGSLRRCCRARLGARLA